MTANQAASPSLFLIPGGMSRCSDPVKARVAAPGQLTNAELDAEADRHRGLHLADLTQPRTRRTPHPGDVLYWVACLGGVCLLLLSATT
jgi:hypothetical protein